MNGALLPHREKHSRWCDQCKHPSTGVLRKARFIWRRAGYPDVFLCVEHAEGVREVT